MQLPSSLILPTALLLLTCRPLLLTAMDPEITNQENEEDLMDRNGIVDWFLSIIGIVTSTPKPELVPPEDCSICECGRTNALKRIVGGQETEINEYPWMALLLDNNRFFCGGSLITDRHVLTAGHCVSGSGAKKLTVRLLEHNRETNDESETITRKVMRVTRHEKYNSFNTDNDIAILLLDEPVNITGRLHPVCMPDPRKSFAGHDGIVTGWGATSEGGDTAISLQEVIVRIISNEECEKTEYGKDSITENMMCAGYPEGGKDSCQGDSGGPLHVDNSNTSIHQIAGIVSWGNGCARPDNPGVYTRVNRYLTWIHSNTADGCYC